MVGLSIQIEGGCTAMRDNELLTVKEVAAYLRVSRVTVWRWCQQGIIPASRLGRNWRIRRDDLLGLLESPKCLPSANSNQHDGSIQESRSGVQAMAVVAPESDDSAQTIKANPKKTSNPDTEQD